MGVLRVDGAVFVFGVCLFGFVWLWCGLADSEMGMDVAQMVMVGLEGTVNVNVTETVC